MINIRKAREEDYEQVYRLVEYIHKIHVKERPDIYRDINPTTISEFKNEIEMKNIIYLIAEDSNKIVGICIAEIKKTTENKLMKSKNIINIKDICVDKEYEKNGIGRKLYSEIEKIASEKAINCIELMVWGFNGNAIRFYESLGMKIKNIRFEKNIKK